MFKIHHITNEVKIIKSETIWHQGFIKTSRQKNESIVIVVYIHSVLNTFLSRVRSIDSALHYFVMIRVLLNLCKIMVI